jgi:hypothetical protein
MRTPTSRCVITWAWEGVTHNATTPAATANRIDIREPPCFIPLRARDRVCARSCAPRTTDYRTLALPDHPDPVGAGRRH